MIVIYVMTFCWMILHNSLSLAGCWLTWRYFARRVNIDRWYRRSWYRLTWRKKKSGVNWMRAVDSILTNGRNLGWIKCVSVNRVFAEIEWYSRLDALFASVAVDDAIGAFHMRGNRYKRRPINLVACDMNSITNQSENSYWKS